MRLGWNRKLFASIATLAMMISLFTSLPATVNALDEEAPENTPNAEVDHSADENQNNSNDVAEQELTSLVQINGEDTDYATLQAAIDAANDGDTVTLLNDVTESVSISKSITLDLNGNTITSESDNRPVTIKTDNAVNATVYNGSLTGGNVDGKSNGGGVYIYIQNADSTITLNQLKITGNTAASGGGVSVTTKGSVIISNCEITNNTLSTNASGSGAGVSTASGNVTVQNSNISNNNASGGNGGGICSRYTTLVVRNSTISENKGASTGGGITASNGTYLELENTTISINSSGLQGGGIFGVQATVKMNNTTISENASNNTGGGLYLSNCTLDENSLRNSRIVNNTASWGGGISVTNCTGVSIPTDLVVNNNTGKNYGASDIYSQYSELTLKAPAEGTLNACGDKIDGWYFDGYNGTQWVGHSEDGKYYAYKYNNDVTFSSKQVVYLKAAHSLATLTVHFVDKEGNTLSADVTETSELGATYNIETAEAENPVNSLSLDSNTASVSVTAPTIGHYYVTSVSPSNTGTLETASTEVTVTYSKLLNLTVHYVDEDGNKVADDYTAEFKKNDEYSVDSPSITGYTTDTTNVAGTMEKDTELTVTYTKLFNLVVHYVDEDGNKVADDYTAVLKKGNEYSVDSPSITGYTTDTTKVSGTLEKDTELTVTYTKLFNLVVHYVDEDGNKVADDYTAVLKKGNEYSVDSPTVSGYTTDTTNVAGTIEKDTELTVKYSKLVNLVIHYVDDKGNTVSKDYTAILKKGDTYSVVSPSISGYTTKTTTVKGTIESDTELTVVYMADKKSVDTGDFTNSVFWAGMFLASLIGVAGIVVLKNRMN